MRPISTDYKTVNVRYIKCIIQQYARFRRHDEVTWMQFYAFIGEDDDNDSSYGRVFSSTVAGQYNAGREHYPHIELQYFTAMLFVAL